MTRPKHGGWRKNSGRTPAEGVGGETRSVRVTINLTPSEWADVQSYAPRWAWTDKRTELVDALCNAVGSKPV